MGCCTSQYRLTAYDVAERHLRDQDLKGRVALITGCTSGLGIETARVLALHGVHVVITGRNEKKLRNAKETIERKGGSGAKVTTISLDLSSFSSIRSCYREFASLSLPLHFLILNAGVMAIPYCETTEGVEMTFGTNHVGHFLLFTLLLPLLKSSRPSRVVVLSSTAHSLSVSVPFRIHYTNLPKPETPSRYDRMAVYQQSKLANLMFAYEVNRRYSHEGVHAFSVHPGVIKTELFDAIPGSSCMTLCGWCCLKSVPQGSATTLYCCVAEGIEERGGEYFADSRWVEGETQKVGEGEYTRLWEWTENFIEKQSQQDESEGNKQDEKEKEKDGKENLL